MEKQQSEKVFIIGEYDKIWERKKGCLELAWRLRFLRKGMLT